jgi:hypothetical protein
MRMTDPAQRAIAKYSPRLVALAKENDLPISQETFDLSINQSPVCRSGGGMSIFGLAPGLVLTPAVLAVDELTPEQSALIDQMLADSLTSAGYNAVASIDLSSVTYGSLTELDAALASVTGTGTSIDNEILWNTKRELRNQYRTAWAVDWPGGHAPYMIFDPYFGWRWPTRQELWGFIGAGCTGAVASSSSNIWAAARAGARAGAISSGSFALVGALSGAVVGAGGAALTSCAVGAVGGGAALVGLLSTN